MGNGLSTHVGYNMDQNNAEAGVYVLDLVATIGGTGAITAVKTKGVTMSRVSPGLYRFTLSKSFTSTLSIIPRITGHAPTTTDGYDGYLTTDSSSSTTNPLFEITFYPKGTSVTATDPASGVGMTVTCRFKLGPV
jgi:hypothetical protein